MSRPPIYPLRQVTLADCALLKTWLAAPHVEEWWDTDDPFDGSDVEDPRVARWIVSHADRPFAYIQDYTVHGWPDHHFAHLPEGSRGIDQYIGRADMLGCGHGTAFITQHLSALFRAGAPAIGTDPHPDNARAIAAYEKAGFRAEGPPRDTRWGLILPMVARPSAG